MKGTDLTTADVSRLRILFDRTIALALKMGWFTHEGLALQLKAKPASVERMIRYARQPEFGGYTVAKRRFVGGSWLYRVLAPGSPIPADGIPAGKHK